MDTKDTDAWRAAFDDRHEFDVYPEHFMSGLRNEFCAGWHAALKDQAASQPKVLTDTMLEKLYWAAMDNAADILKFMDEAHALLEAGK